MNKRRAARFAAIQALYQAELSGQDIELVIAEFQAYRLQKLLEPLDLDDDDDDLDQAPAVDRDWFEAIAKGTFDAVSDLDGKIEKTLSSGWSLNRLGYLLRAFLRAGAFELFHRPDVPIKAVINEYLELAHAFLEQDDVGFLNAVLDKLGADARQPENDRPASPVNADA